HRAHASRLHLDVQANHHWKRQERGPSPKGHETPLGSSETAGKGAQGMTANERGRLRIPKIPVRTVVIHAIAWGIGLLWLFPFHINSFSRLSCSWRSPSKWSRFPFSSR